MIICIVKIQFPSGTSLEVHFHYIEDLGHFEAGKWTLDLHVNPSIADEDRSQGLCGTVGTKKLLNPNNVDKSNMILDFTRSWKYVFLFKKLVKICKKVLVTLSSKMC